MFKTDSAAPKVVAYKLPTLFISPVAMDKMEAYIELVDTEVGWLGTVQQCGKPEEQVYYLEDVYLPYQDVNGGTTEITPDGMMKVAQELNDDDKIARLSFWGHSHVNMSVGPSGQDSDQVKLFQENGLPYMFRAIANKKGDFGLTFFDFKTGVSVENVRWELYYDAGVDKAAIKAEIAEKVSQKVYKVANYGFNGRFFGGEDTQLTIDARFDEWQKNNKRGKYNKRGKGRGADEIVTPDLLRSCAEAELIEGQSGINLATIKVLLDEAVGYQRVLTPDMADFLEAYDMEWWELRNMVRILNKNGKLKALLEGGK